MERQDGVILHEADSGQTLELAVGQALSVELRELGTAGYTWKWEGLDEPVLAPAGTSTRPSPAMGGAGTATLRFQAKAPGSTRLQLKLWRPWLGDSSVVARFEALLHVH